MLLSQVREIVTFAINEPQPSLGIIAFHKGSVVPDWMLARTIDAATRGAITSDGERLLLIPPRVYAQAKRDSVARIKAAPKRKSGKKRSLIPWPEIKKRECLALCDYLPVCGSELGPTKTQNLIQRPYKQTAAEGPKGNACRVTQGCTQNSHHRQRNLWRVWDRASG